MKRIFSGRPIRGLLRGALRDARGQVLAIVALALPVLLGAGAISVDVGYMYMARAAIQNAADAGSRAGAAILAEGGDEDAARAEATSFANQNIASNSFLTGATPTVTFPTADSVKVDITHNLSLFFAQAIGFGSTNITASATAALAAAREMDPNTVVPLAVYCNNSNGCAGALAVGQTHTLQRYCGNFFSDGSNGSACGNTISDGENFLMGITFDDSNGTSAFRNAVHYGYGGSVAMGQQARALPGNRNGWQSGMEARLTEGGGTSEMTLAVIRELSPANGDYNVEVVDFIQVIVTSFSEAGNTDQTTFQIVRSGVSTTDYAASNEGLGINSVVGVRLSD
ncbi:MAG: TadE/TadG family type IV pilus assembly protein [bacterium]